jgi:YD repeat-containing protein
LRHFLTSITQPDPDGEDGPLSPPVTTYEYYDDGLLYREHRPEFLAGLFNEYAYDANGNLLTITAPLAGQLTQFTYDQLNRRRTQTDASGRTITYKYLCSCPVGMLEKSGDLLKTARVILLGESLRIGSFALAT